MEFINILDIFKDWILFRYLIVSFSFLGIFMFLKRLVIGK